MSSVIKNRHQLQVIAPVVVVSTSMIGGCYWPLEIVRSRMLIAASKFVPQGWAVKALKDLIVYNRGFEVVYLPAAVLILMGVVFLGTALHIREKCE
jgi:ABC-2 type transport system permease protein